MNQHDEDVEVAPRYKMWIDEASAALGMDICALDGVHSSIDDKEYIIELNDSAIGLVNRFQNEDVNFIRDLVIVRMETIFVKQPDTLPIPMENKITTLEEQIATLHLQLERALQNKRAEPKSEKKEEKQKHGLSFSYLLARKNN